MALTPEDVVNKRFQQTKFREGYDQDEVDDFLDEVVVELRRLTAENEELRAENERLRSEGAAAAPVDTETTDEQFEQQRVADAPAAEQQFESTPQPLAAPVQQAPVADEAGESQSLLVLARQLHDQHVAEGTKKRDQLIADAEARARQLVNDAESEAKTANERSQQRSTQLVSDAENRAQTLLADAEQKSSTLLSDAESKSTNLVTAAENKEREITSRLEATKQKLEERIEELRVCERDYRSNLRSFIETQLNDLNSTSAEVEADQQ